MPFGIVWAGPYGLMMPSLDDHQTRIMAAIVTAHRFRGEGGRRYPMHHIRAGGMQEHIQHHAWPDDMAGVHIGREDLEDLEGFGLLDIERLRTWWKIAPTAYGMEVVDEYHEDVAAAEREAQVEDAAALSTDWAVVGPIVEAIVRGAELSWRHGGASLDELEEKLPLKQRAGLGTRISYLESGGWVERAPGAQPKRYRPTEKALRGYRQWPADPDEAVGQALLQRIAEALENEQAPEQREKLGAFRNAAVDLGAKTLGEIAARAGGVG